MRNFFTWCLFVAKPGCGPRSPSLRRSLSSRAGRSLGPPEFPRSLRASQLGRILGTPVTPTRRRQLPLLIRPRLILPLLIRPPLIWPLLIRPLLIRQLI